MASILCSLTTGAVAEIRLTRSRSDGSEFRSLAVAHTAELASVPLDYYVLFVSG